MLGFWVDEIARRTARFRFTRARVPDGIVKINLGSGLHVAPGWINVDGSVHAMLAGAPRPILSLLYRSSNSIRQTLSEDEYVRRLTTNRFVFAQLEGKLPFNDAVADYIYSSHVLEHFFLEDARLFLREIRRVLKPGGGVRICVPDLDYAMSLDSKRTLHFFFTESRAGYYHQHRYMYNFDLLSELLMECGFEQVRRERFQSGQVPDLLMLDNRPEETLYVEARKSANATTSEQDSELHGR